MSTFTRRLKDVIDDSPEGIGLDLYPIFDEERRAPLNLKIVDHFWNQEIGVESISLFKFNLARKMNEIMPFYNQLYQTERIKFDPLATMSIQSVSDSLGENRVATEAKSKSLGENVANAITVNSDYPQTSLGQNTTGNFATSATESDSKAKSDALVDDTRTDLTNSKDESRNSTTGFSGPASDLLQRYRATILNIDMAVIGDLQELFMSVWDNGDSFTESRAV